MLKLDTTNTSAPLPATWNTFLQNQKENTFFYHPSWIQLLSRLYGYQFTPLVTHTSTGEINGVLPLYTMRSSISGKRMVSLPFSDHCPLSATDDQSANTLVDQAIEMVQQQKGRYLELRTGFHPLLAERSDLVSSDLYVRWRLPLTDDIEALWKGLRRPVQHQVKKAEKRGVKVIIANTSRQMERYYQMHLQTRSKKHGMPAQPRNFFHGLWEAFAPSGKVQVLLATYEEQIIAGMVLLVSGDQVNYAYGASDERFLDLAPNNLLMWKAITWSGSHGYHSLDMGRTARANEGLMEFKRRWGAQQEEMPYYYYPRMNGLAAESENSRKVQFIRNSWRKLPLQVSGPLGGFLYKHLG